VHYPGNQRLVQKNIKTDFRRRKKAELRGMPCNPEGVEFCEICNMSFGRKETYYKHAKELLKV